MKIKRLLGLHFFFWRGRGGEGASLAAQMVKNLPVMQETWVPSWGGKDALEEMATHSRAGGSQPMGSQRVGHD